MKCYESFGEVWKAFDQAKNQNKICLFSFIPIYSHKFPFINVDSDFLPELSKAYIFFSIIVNQNDG